MGTAPGIAVGSAAPGPKRPFQKVISRVLALRRRSFPGPRMYVAIVSSRTNGDEPRDHHDPSSRPIDGKGVTNSVTALITEYCGWQTFVAMRCIVDGHHQVGRDATATPWESTH